MENVIGISQGIFGDIAGILKSILQVFDLTWWLLAPPILFSIFWHYRLIYLRTEFVKTISWSIFEFKIPADIMKTPKAMEQIFASLYVTYSFGMTTINTYIEGKIERWMSFEIVGYSHGVHFYVHIPTAFKNLLESAIYAQYPGVEIVPVEDYAELMPPKVPNQDYEIWGTSYMFNKENFYPIRTYSYFEEQKEERRVDPVAAITEVMSNLKEGEKIWLQFVICPTGKETDNYWQKEGQEKIDEMAGRKKPAAKKGLFPGLAEFARNFVLAPVKYPEWAGQQEEKKEISVRLHAAEQDVVKAIINKISKPGFETIIRFINMGYKGSFNVTNNSAIMGTFHQYNDQYLNGLRPDKKTITIATTWRAKFSPRYKARKEYAQKRRLYDAYISRQFGEYNKFGQYVVPRGKKIPILSTEELATIYHFPIIGVEAPKLGKLETKKGGAPANLPIE